MKWSELVALPDRAVGEVAGIEGSKIEVFIYPEHFPKIHVGSIIVINSGSIKPIGLVLKLAHTSKLGTFTPLKKPKEELSKMFPDLEKYYKFVVTLSYTSHVINDEVSHYRTSMPKLHDLAYLVNDPDLVAGFIKPSGILNLDFLMYYISDGASIIEFRDFILNYSRIINKITNRKEFIDGLVKVLTKIGIRDVITYIEEVVRILGW